MQCISPFSYSVHPALHNVLIDVAHTHRHGTRSPYVPVFSTHSTYVYDLRMRPHVSTAQGSITLISWHQAKCRKGCTPAWWAREVPQAWPNCPQPASCALCSCLRTHYISVVRKLMVSIMMGGCSTRQQCFVHSHFLRLICSKVSKVMKLGLVFGCLSWLQSYDVSTLEAEPTCCFLAGNCDGAHLFGHMSERCSVAHSPSPFCSWSEWTAAALAQQLAHAAA